MGAILGTLAAVIWAGLILGRGWFWRSGPTLEWSDAGSEEPDGVMPGVVVVVPARNEAEHIQQSVGSLLAQDYAGPLHVIVVDDDSDDGTGRLARAAGGESGRLTVMSGAPLPQGWSGKMWAVSQGLGEAEARNPAFVLLTDADIVHGRGHVRRLVHMATRSSAAPLDLVSEMVRLRTESFAERALIPAFVFFFQLLYPFQWVNERRRTQAAAAGGTMLVSRAALQRVDGVRRIRGALIDDVALAREVKRGGHAIWLGHATEALSLRRYAEFGDVFRMVSRTAYVQLDYSPVLLAGTIAGLTLLYVCPVLLAVCARGRSRRLGAASWVMLALAFQPTLRRYRRSPVWGAFLPAIASFYMAATIGSAVQQARGRGGQWKDRVY